MRILQLFFLCAEVLFLVDMFYYKGRYRNEMWRDMQYEGQKFNYGDTKVNEVLGPWPALPPIIIVKQ